jgi:hypothetical protein
MVSYAWVAGGGAVVIGLLALGVFLSARRMSRAVLCKPQDPHDHAPSLPAQPSSYSDPGGLRLNAPGGQDRAKPGWAVSRQ